MPKFSIVTSLYYSAPYLEELYERTLTEIKKYSEEYEFIFVDDGSPDNGNEIVKKLIEKDSNVKLVELSRNFGHHKAIMIGLEHSTGDFIFMFDSDLEEDPALLDTFYQLMTDSDESIDVVYGVMDSRKGKLFERASGALFYKLINLMSDTPIPSNIMAARLMTRAYVDNLVRYQEAHVYLGGVMSLAGFKQVGFRSDKGSKGVTTYSLPRKVQLALDALISYTNKPLTFIASFGLTISGLAFMVVLYLIGRALYTDVPVEGWHMVLGSIWLLGGLTISAIGLVGFYVGRIFVQVKQRPNAIVKKVHERK